MEGGNEGKRIRTMKVCMQGTLVRKWEFKRDEG
jgi:hypothetical protein